MSKTVKIQKMWYEISEDTRQYTRDIHVISEDGIEYVFRSAYIVDIRSSDDERDEYEEE